MTTKMVNQVGAGGREFDSGEGYGRLNIAMKSKPFQQGTAIFRHFGYFKKYLDIGPSFLTRASQLTELG